jgi:cell division cycle-associated protein 7
MLSSVDRVVLYVTADGKQFKQVPFYFLAGVLSKLTAAGSEDEDDTWEDDKEGKWAVAVAKERVQALQERRCDSRGRGGVYDSVLGICCHFCRYTLIITNMNHRLVLLRKTARD